MISVHEEGIWTEGNLMEGHREKSGMEEHMNVGGRITCGSVVWLEDRV